MDRNNIKKGLFAGYIVLWAIIAYTLLKLCNFFVFGTSFSKFGYILLSFGFCLLIGAGLKIFDIIFYRNSEYEIINFSSQLTQSSKIWLTKKYKLSLIFLIPAVLMLYKFYGINSSITLILGVISGISADFSYYIILPKILPKIPYTVDESINSTVKFNYKLAISLAFIGVSIPIIFYSLITILYKDLVQTLYFLLGFIFIALISYITNASSKLSAKTANTIIENFSAGVTKKDKRNPLLYLFGLNKINKVVNFGFELPICIIASLISSVILGFAFREIAGYIPLLLIGLGVFSSLCVTLLTNLKMTFDPAKTLYITAIISSIIYLVLSYFGFSYLIKEDMFLFKDVVLGTIGGLILVITNYKYINSKSKPARSVLNSSGRGTSPTFIQSLKEGVSGTILPALIISFIVIASYILSKGNYNEIQGLYGISLAIISIFNSAGIILISYIFSLTGKNIDKIGDNSESDYPKTQQNTRIIALNSISYTVNLFCKNFSNSSNFLSTLILIIAICYAVGINKINLLNPFVIVSFILGGAIPFIFTSFSISNISKVAKALAFETQKQFRTYPQILRYEIRPNYDKLVATVQRDLTIRAFYNILIVIFILFLIIKFLTPEGYCGLLFGMLTVSFYFNFITSNASATIKSAKKYFKEEFINAQMSEEYNNMTETEGIFSDIKALIYPTANLLIKFIIILSVVLVPIIN